MKEWKTLKDFYFNRNKFCSIIISLIFFIFSSHVYGESVKDIICVGPDNKTRGEEGTEGSFDPCNLAALQAENAAVDRVGVTLHTNILTSSGENEQPQPKVDSDETAGGVQ